MLKITFQYIPIDTDVAFLRIKQQYIHIKPWLIAFFVHVFASMGALIAGFTQFSSYLLKKHKPIHRIMGKVYVFDILFLTGPSGLIMSFYANGGYIGRASFILLSVLWLYTTTNAYLSARKSDFVSHQNMMILSYSLTLSAITLRAWKWLIFVGAETFFQLELPPKTVYICVAWLGWVPNFLIGLYLISDKKRLAFFTKNKIV